MDLTWPTTLRALAKEKWPDATASQLLQSLIRNTGSTPHELEWSSTFGHGIANATRLVQEDPSQYPDENPLFADAEVLPVREAGREHFGLGNVLCALSMLSTIMGRRRVGRAGVPDGGEHHGSADRC